MIWESVDAEYNDSDELLYQCIYCGNCEWSDRDYIPDGWSDEITCGECA